LQGKLFKSDYHVFIIEIMISCLLSTKQWNLGFTGHNVKCIRRTAYYRTRCQHTYVSVDKIRMLCTA